MAKVSIIGAGNVGATTAYFIAKQNIADVVLVDVVEGMPQSKAQDFLHASSSIGFGNSIHGTNDYADIADSDVVIHTAGIPRKPGMDRMDLLKTNVGIAKTAAQNIRRYAPRSVIVGVANPLDVICMVLFRESGFDIRRVVGMAGVLDSTRFQYFMAEKLGGRPGDVRAMVLGGHGDSMVPVTAYTSVGGFRIDELLDAESVESLSSRTKTGGGEIVSYLKSGSAFYAPAASVATMVDGIVTDRKRICAASAYLRGEYGYHDIFLGVPVMLGKNGVERVFELPLTENQKAALDHSAEHVLGGVETLDTIYSVG
ncbi:MAG: malate dehydrogenase [Spirochaetales bacterium]